MKIVILAGGLPSSITDEAEGLPKPMVEIGGRPVLWHIMKHFSTYGYRDFIICGGYKVNSIKDYFNDFYSYQSDITVDLRNNQVQLHNNITEDWKVTVVDTGLNASTGSRVKQIAGYVGEEDFIVSYGDCISDIDVNKFVESFYKNGRLATMALARPAGRNVIVSVDEKGIYHGYEDTADTQSCTSWVNANLFVFHNQVFQFFQGDKALEKELLEHLVQEQQVATYKHDGFWRPVETIRDRIELDNMWNTHREKWKAR